MAYELYYWPGVPGRGEFIRLAFEEAGVEYTDVVRLPEDRGGGIEAMMEYLEGKHPGLLPFAPPFLKADDLVLAQTANILQFLGPRLGLVPEAPAARLRAHQIMLTVMDFVAEVHDVHHPIWSGLYYEEQTEEALRRAPYLLRERIPKFLGYFERLLERDGHLVSDAISYPDLALFHVLEGLRYAFPKAMRTIETKVPRLIALGDRVRERPRIAAYLASQRRAPFNEHGAFRHYPELDSTD